MSEIAKMYDEKKFTAAIYLFRGKAIAGWDDFTVLSEEPAMLAKEYSDNNVDEIIVFDLSNGDAEHDRSISDLKRIIEEVEVPVIGCGNIRRFEDVKKILYAGCQKAALNYSLESNIAITQEVSKRFGKDKIAVCIDSKEQISANRMLLNDFVSELILVKRDGGYDNGSVKDVLANTEHPVTVLMPEVVPAGIVEILKREEVSGVYGPEVNRNVRQINALKAFCSEQGLKVNGFDAKLSFKDLKVNSDGLVPVIVQDYKTKQVLMLAYMDEEAFNTTILTGRMTYYSRSRKEQWIKGETSGHYQFVKSLTADCDKDTLLAKVSQVGAACHTGSYSCFFNEVIKKEYLDTDPLKVFEDVYAVIMDRKINPKEGSYTNYLFDKGIDKILKKVGEENTEIIIAAKNPDADEIKYEISDYLYHLMVLMAEKGVTWEDITRELARR